MDANNKEYETPVETGVVAATIGSACSGTLPYVEAIEYEVKVASEIITDYMKKTSLEVNVASEKIIQDVWNASSEVKFATKKLREHYTRASSEIIDLLTENMKQMRQSVDDFCSKSSSFTKNQEETKLEYVRSKSMNFSRATNRGKGSLYTSGLMERSQTCPDLFLAKSNQMSDSGHNEVFHPRSLSRNRKVHPHLTLRNKKSTSTSDIENTGRKEVFNQCFVRQRSIRHRRVRPCQTLRNGSQTTLSDIEDEVFTNDDANQTTASTESDYDGIRNSTTKMINLSLNQSADNFGFDVQVEEGSENKITICDITVNGAADVDGKIRERDEILSIDGDDVQDFGLQRVKELLRRAASNRHVSLKIKCATTYFCGNCGADRNAD